MAASGAAHNTILASLGLAALIALPLYTINMLVHLATRAVKPDANTVGLVQLLASLIFLTPIEAALVLPAINLFVSGRVLKAHAGGVAALLDTQSSSGPSACDKDRVRLGSNARRRNNGNQTHADSR